MERMKVRGSSTSIVDKSLNSVMSFNRIFPIPKQNKTKTKTKKIKIKKLKINQKN